MGELLLAKTLKSKMPSRRKTIQALRGLDRRCFFFFFPQFLLRMPIAMRMQDIPWSKASRKIQDAADALFPEVMAFDDSNVGREKRKGMEAGGPGPDSKEEEEAERVACMKVD